jgi:hypothetical protein
MILMILRILILMMFCLPVLADTTAIVERVQEKAAYQRYGRQHPVKLGTELRSGDIITTSRNARIQIRFPDDSFVRIGGGARVDFNRLIPPAKNKGVLRLVFNVLKGVFRFTSNAKADVKINVGNSITVGVRGTDIYTNAQPDQDTVCLIKGKITVQSGKLNLILTQHREGFIVPKVGMTKGLPIRQVISNEQFEMWLKKSEFSD